MLSPLLLHARDPHSLSARARSEEDTEGEAEPGDKLADFVFVGLLGAIIDVAWTAFDEDAAELEPGEENWPEEGRPEGR